MRFEAGAWEHAVIDHVDVAIVGGGAAGIAAARRLIEQKRSVLLMEALPQLGGRARSVILRDMPLDYGCGWFHSAERNPLAYLAQKQTQVLDRRETTWQKYLPNAIYTLADRRDARTAYEQFLRQIHSDPPESDRASDVFISDQRWKPYIDAVSSFMNGTELDNLSVRDFIAYDDAASDANWRIEGGYGAFIVGLGESLPMTLNTRVSSISLDGKNVVLKTNRGDITAASAIVTVSTTILARGEIRFDPIVDDHLHAAQRLPLGLADKVFLWIEEASSIPSDSHVLGSLERTNTAGYSIRPFGRPVIECYLGGECARMLEEGGEQSAYAFVVDELRGLFGAEFVRGLTLLAVTRWGKEASIGGSYSHALPGYADARAVLARPVSERFCFAGEACSPRDFSTAHGAWQSGLAAAEWIGQFL